MLVGVICPFDQSYQSFDHCINCHYGRGEETRNCDAPVYILKLMRDNHIARKHAGWSASTVLDCPRAIVLRERYDYYEALLSGWNKGRGTWVHAMIESDNDPPPWIVREKRVRKGIFIENEDVFITGQPDEIDTEKGILIDYKSKESVPKQQDPRHEAQFNIYVWLLDGGFFLTEEGTLEKQVNIKIVKGGMHYVTWRTKEPIFKKMGYAVWDQKETENMIISRVLPLIRSKREHVLPSCSPYISYGRNWRCDCSRLEEQLESRGILVDEKW